MSRSTSAYLDLLRFAAAFVVFLSHLGGNIGGHFLPGMAVYGTPAVVVFFVLSGYVIAFVTYNRETTARDYIIARCARLYSVIVPTLALTALFDWLGSGADPDIYRRFELVIGPGIWNLPACLLFLNALWGHIINPGTNEAYWSLGYEAIYYAIFGAAFFLRGSVRIFVCAALSLIAGPNIIIFFGVWFLGCASYQTSIKGLIGRRLGLATFTLSIAVAVAFLVWARSKGFLRTEIGLPNHKLWFIVQDFIFGVIVSVNLVGIASIGDTFSQPIRYVGPLIRWLAGATFTLYLLHVPIILLVRATVPVDHRSLSYDGVLMIVPLAVIFLVAEFTERRKQFWKDLFSWAFIRMPHRATGK